MIKFRGEQGRFKVARTVVPHTAEFKLYRDAEADKSKSDLICSALTAIGRGVDAHPDPDKTGLKPDDLYETVMEQQGLRKRWEEAFGGEEQGRDLFGLVAWIYFFKHDATWLATPPDITGTGKQNWTYVAEREAPPVEPQERVGPKYDLRQCVRWVDMNRYGRIISEPRIKDGLMPEIYYLVRSTPLLDVPGNQEETWIVEDNLEPADDQYCKGIDPKA